MMQFKNFMECKDSFQYKYLYRKKNLQLFVFLIMVLLCSIGEVSQAAEIGYTKKDRDFSKDIYSLWICGDIQEGDFLKFNQKVESILKSGGIIADVQLSSFGGNTTEAMQIGKRIRELCLKTGTFDFSYSECENCAQECSSACFIIWAGGVDRSSGAMNREPFLEIRNIGIHRPKFPEKFFKGLSKKEADKKYNEMSMELYEYLEEMNIPINLIDQMFQISSDSIHYLSSEQTHLLSEVPFFEEWIMANCGSISRIRWSQLRLISEKIKAKAGKRPPLTKEEQISYNKNKKMYHDYWNCYYEKLSEIQTSK